MNTNDRLNHSYSLFITGSINLDDLLTEVLRYGRLKFRRASYNLSTVANRRHTDNGESDESATGYSRSYNDQLASQLSWAVARSLPGYTGPDARKPFDASRGTFAAFVGVMASSIHKDLKRVTKTKDQKFLVRSLDLQQVNEDGEEMPDILTLAAERDAIVWVNGRAEPPTRCGRSSEPYAHRQAVLSEFEGSLSVRALAAYKRLSKGDEDAKDVDFVAKKLADYNDGKITRNAKAKKQGRPALSFPISVRPIPDAPFCYHYPTVDTNTQRGRTVHRPAYLGVTNNERNLCKPQTSTRASLSLCAAN